MNWQTFWSTVVSLLAIAVAVAHGRATRRHDRISTMPLPSVRLTWSNDDPKLLIHLVNKGLGPAYLMSTVAFIDDDRHELNSYDDFGRLIASTGLTKCKLRVGDPTSRIPLPDRRFVRYAIAPGEELLFLEVSTDVSMVQLHESLRRLTFKFEFESPYGDKFSDHLAFADQAPAQDQAYTPDVIRPVKEK